MANNITILGLTRTSFRVARQGCSSRGTITVNLDDPKVRRDLAAHKGLWVVSGGSQPAGSDKQIQFNDGGTAFGASPDLIWDNIANTIKLGSDPNGTVAIKGNAPGVQITLAGADGDATHPGGEVQIISGNSPDTGGNMTVAAGDGTAGTGGSISIASGWSTEWDGGDISIRANPFTAAGHNGGDINIVAGQGVNQGGSIIGQGGSPDGNIQLYSGDGNQGIQLDNNGLHVGATKLGFYGVTPAIQPGVPVTLGNVIAALQVLGLVAT